MWSITGILLTQPAAFTSGFTVTKPTPDRQGPFSLPTHTYATSINVPMSGPVAPRRGPPYATVRSATSQSRESRCLRNRRGLIPTKPRNEWSSRSPSRRRTRFGQPFCHTPRDDVRHEGASFPRVGAFVPPPMSPDFGLVVEVSAIFQVTIVRLLAPVTKGKAEFLRHLGGAFESLPTMAVHRRKSRAGRS